MNERTDVASQTRLADFDRFACGNVIRKELVALLSLPTATTGNDIMNDVTQDFFL